MGSSGTWYRSFGVCCPHLVSHSTYSPTLNVRAVHNYRKLGSPCTTQFLWNQNWSWIQMNSFKINLKYRIFTPSRKVKQMQYKTENSCLWPWTTAVIIYSHQVSSLLPSSLHSPIFTYHQDLVSENSDSFQSLKLKIKAIHT